ncbi:hypothetical protein ILUMI_17510 [Ignelater luminosus]|uniref:Uncharacterized protein n=1 Tax=Ignelater luminosus TaxID=2038154 RepID=A0A8K0CQB9_IGNLU|nr:hypothetical protein ILUMI_17510 [Ignelater luminosus]
MEQVVRAVISSSMGYKWALDQFQVPLTILESYVRKKRAAPDYAVVKSLGKFISVFSKKQEKELVAYLHKMEVHRFGLTIKELRTLAFQLAERNNFFYSFKDEAAV